MSTDTGASCIRIERHGEIAILRLARPPVNAIEGAFCRDLVAALDALEADTEVRGVILAGRPGLFSAGLDLPALLALDQAGMREFWYAFTGMFLRLWSSPLCIVAAIEGHAPAGGTVLAIACDHRIMADGPYKMGLNEVEVGLGVPVFLCAVVRSMLGQRVAERVLTQGLLLTPLEALAVGFVDEVVAQADVMRRAHAELAVRLARPEAARRATKTALRRPHADAIRAGLDAEVDAFLAFWFSDDCQRELQRVVAALAARKKA
ncbi:MAG: hypothetical protein RIT45_1972 [Pseudomonadota bacterium]|jgi:enoyl-CoA hydratase/carnithine racemase